MQSNMKGSEKVCSKGTWLSLLNLNKDCLAKIRSEKFWGFAEALVVSALANPALGIIEVSLICRDAKVFTAVPLLRMESAEVCAYGVSQRQSLIREAEPLGEK